MIIRPVKEIRSSELKKRFYQKFLIQKDPIKIGLDQKLIYRDDNSRYIDWYYNHSSDSCIKELVNELDGELISQDLSLSVISIMPTELDSDIELVANMPQEYKNKLAELAKCRLEQVGSENYNWVVSFYDITYLNFAKNTDCDEHICSHRKDIMSKPSPPNSLFIWSSFFRLSLGTIINLAEGKPALKYLFELPEPLVLDYPKVVINYFAR